MLFIDQAATVSRRARMLADCGLSRGRSADTCQHPPHLPSTHTCTRTCPSPSLPAQAYPAHLRQRLGALPPHDSVLFWPAVVAMGGALKHGDEAPLAAVINADQETRGCMTYPRVQASTCALAIAGGRVLATLLASPQTAAGARLREVSQLLGGLQHAYAIPFAQIVVEKQGALAGWGQKLVRA